MQPHQTEQSEVDTLRVHIFHKREYRVFGEIRIGPVQKTAIARMSKTLRTEWEGVNTTKKRIEVI
jgi:hypothetical protein